MTPEYYDEKAQHCFNLIRSCRDARALSALKKLAEEYTAMAAALRRKDAEEHEHAVGVDEP
jgi:hypothetical protein